jgi:glycosyltransferase involved in cell wall biosynthesis
MKPILYSVLPRPPHPTRDGLAIRNYHLLAGLAREFRVRAAALVPPHLRGSGGYPPGVEVEEVRQPARRARQAAALAESVFSKEAYPALLYRSRALLSLLSRWTARERPAWIVAHSYHVAPAALCAGAPAWVDFHNVDSEIWRRMGERAAGPLRAFLRWQAPRVARLERDVLRRAAGASCVSERDARALCSEGGAPPLVVTNGVDLTRYVFRAEPSSEELVFFVGDLTWPPNLEGIRWFLSEVWPILARMRPSAKVEVLGRGEGSLRGLSRQGPPGLSFLGEGEDTRPLWRRAAVAIVPVLTGGGTRLKILEAAACGVPVVATPVGAEGLDFAAGREIALASGASEFAAAIARLLAEPGARRLQAAAGRQRVEGQYGWEAIGRRFAEMLRVRTAGA